MRVQSTCSTVFLSDDDSADDGVLSTKKQLACSSGPSSSQLISAIEESLKDFPKQDYFTNTTGDNNDFDMELVESYYKQIIDQILERNLELEKENKILKDAYDKCKSESVKRASEIEEYVQKYDQTFVVKQNEITTSAAARNNISSNDETDSSDDEVPSGKCVIKGCNGQGNTLPNRATHRKPEFCPLNNPCKVTSTSIGKKTSENHEANVLRLSELER
jgi:hypothetical protein